MGGRIEGASMSLKGQPTVTIVWGSWTVERIHAPHIVGVFADEAEAKRVAEEIKTLDPPRVWSSTSTFFVQ